MIVYYITSHGFGHAARSLQVVRRLAERSPVTIKTAVPDWFVDQFIAPGECERMAAAYDCGAIQRDGMEIDTAATFATYRRIMRENDARFADEASWLRRVGVRLVVCDVPAFPFRCAREAGVPSVALCNFTWFEIYQDLARGVDEPTVRADADACLASLRADYALADRALLTPPHIAINVFPRAETTPILARSGESRRAEIAATLGLDPDHRSVLIYVGAQGLDGADWSRLADINAQFLTLHPLGDGAPNLREIPNGHWAHPDIVASCDAVAAKPGYGIVGECLATATPLLYTPRDNFIEYPALRDALDQWGLAERVDNASFRALDWTAALERLSQRSIQQTFDLNGAEYCANRCLEWAGMKQKSRMDKRG